LEDVAVGIIIRRLVIKRVETRDRERKNNNRRRGGKKEGRDESLITMLDEKTGRAEEKSTYFQMRRSNLLSGIGIYIDPSEKANSGKEGTTKLR